SLSKAFARRGYRGVAPATTRRLACGADNPAVDRDGADDRARSVSDAPSTRRRSAPSAALQPDHAPTAFGPRFQLAAWAGHDRLQLLRPTSAKGPAGAVSAGSSATEGVGHWLTWAPSCRERGPKPEAGRQAEPDPAAPHRHIRECGLSGWASG